jgi:CRP/FNR family transcriptional regulator, cyclic AMP receptor protein
VVSVPKGEFSLRENVPCERGTFGLLMLEGLLLRGVSVDVRPTVEVLGAGDLIHPSHGVGNPDATVPVEVRWWALRPARLAVLDAPFVCRMSDYPVVLGELAGRLARASITSSLQLSIVQQPNLSRRLQFTFWHLADRFGRVQPGGAVLPLPLCHSLLAWLVGARRPAVSRALKELERAGQVQRRADDTWWLARAPAERSIEPAAPPQHLAV